MQTDWPDCRLHLDSPACFSWFLECCPASGSFSAKMCYFYFRMLIEHGPKGCWNRLWVIPKPFPPISSHKNVPCSCSPGKIAPTSSMKPLPTPRVIHDLPEATPTMCVIMWYVTASQMWLWASWVWGLILMCVCVCADWGEGRRVCYCSPDLTHRAFPLLLHSSIWSHQAHFWEHTAAATTVKLKGELRSPGQSPDLPLPHRAHLTSHLPGPLP